MKKKLAAARKRIENGDGIKGGDEEVEVTNSPFLSYIFISSYFILSSPLFFFLHCFHKYHISIVFSLADHLTSCHLLTCHVNP